MGIGLPNINFLLINFQRGRGGPAATSMLIKNSLRNQTHNFWPGPSKVNVADLPIVLNFPK